MPGIYGIDTRAVTMKLRDTGSLKGKIIIDVSCLWQGVLCCALICMADVMVVAGVCGDL